MFYHCCLARLSALSRNLENARLVLFQVMVTVWKREAEKAEVQELGYLSVLQQREPTHTFRHDLNTFKAQGMFIILTAGTEACALKDEL